MNRSLFMVERVAAYATALTYDQITPDALEICKSLLFDSLGTGLGGFRHALGQKVVAYTARLPECEDATILGSGKLIARKEAAFANATMIKILGMDDSHLYLIIVWKSKKRMMCEDCSP